MRQPQRIGLDLDYADAVVAQLIGTKKSLLLAGTPSAALQTQLAANECIWEEIAPAQELLSILDARPFQGLCGPRRFDAVVFLDVLDALANPLRVMDEARAAIRDTGSLVAMVRNGAHGAIRAALLAGRFEATRSDIVDGRPPRLLTVDTLEQLFSSAGYAITHIGRQRSALGADSPLLPSIDPADLSPDLRARLENDPECETLRFIVQASPLSESARLRVLTQRVFALSGKVHETRVSLEERTRQCHEANDELARTREHLAKADLEMRNAQFRADESEAAVEALRGAVAEQRWRLEHLEAELSVQCELAEKRRETLDRVTQELSQAQTAADEGAAQRERAALLEADIAAYGRVNNALLLELQAVRQALRSSEEDAVRDRETARESLRSVHARLDALHSELITERSRREEHEAAYKSLQQRALDIVFRQERRLRVQRESVEREIEAIERSSTWKVRRMFRHMFGRGG